MPSKKGMEQALTWLKSKMAEKDTLDAVNAEVCYNVILDLKQKKTVLGAIYHQNRVAKKKTEELYEQAMAAMDRYSKMEETQYIPVEDVDLPEEWNDTGGVTI